MEIADASAAVTSRAARTAGRVARRCATVVDRLEGFMLHAPSATRYLTSSARDGKTLAAARAGASADSIATTAMPTHTIA